MIIFLFPCPLLLFGILQSMFYLYLCISSCLSFPCTSSLNTRNTMRYFESMQKRRLMTQSLPVPPSSGRQTAPPGSCSSLKDTEASLRQLDWPLVVNPRECFVQPCRQQQQQHPGRAEFTQP